MSGLALVTFVVREYDEAIDFFVRALGWRLVEDRRLSAEKRWVVVRPEQGGAGLLLARAVGPEQEKAIGNQAGGRVAFFLEVADFAVARARMEAEGVMFLEGPRDEPYGRVAVFADLYGNRWDLIEPR